jgi:chromosome segregation ATPase
LESSDKLKLKIFELEKSENDKEELNKSSDQFGIKISELKDALGLLKNENKELSDKFSNSSNHNEALRASNVSLMSELEIIKDEFLTSKDGREELTIKCGNFESEIEGLNSKLLINDENSEKQIKVLGEELGDLKRCISYFFIHSFMR